MSFLPYAPARSGTWIASVGGSTAIHGAVVFGLLTSSVALLPEPSSPAVREPEYEITLEILDADIIDLDDIEEEPLIPPDAIPLEPDVAEAEQLDDSIEALTPEEETAAFTPEDEALAPVEDALQPQEDVLPQPEDIVAPEPEVVEPEVEALAALDPEPDLPEVIEEDPVAPEVIQEPEPEPIAPVAAVDPDDLAIDDLSLVDDTVFSPLAEGVAPAPLPEAVAPDAIDPVVTIPEEDIAAVVLPEPEIVAQEPEPEQVEPTALPIEEEEELAALPDPEPEPEPTPEVGEEETAAVSDPAPAAPAVIANPSPSALQIGALIRSIRATPAPQCTLALPRRAGDGGVGVSMLGANVETLDTLAARIVDGLDPAPAQSREVLDQRQCAALDAIRLSTSYPASRIGLAVENTILQSGDTLRARVVGAGGLYLTLVLVDDNGVVQDLARFTTIEGQEPVIDVPVARAGPSRDTRQLLVVLGSPDAPIDLSAGIGAEAQDAFGALPSDVLESAVFGVVTVDVR
ncbi:MAG: hypothetical protein AAFP16_00310 [Pseudomonadota bacterium]